MQALTQSKAFAGAAVVAKQTARQGAVRAPVAVRAAAKEEVGPAGGRQGPVGPGLAADMAAYRSVAMARLPAPRGPPPPLPVFTCPMPACARRAWTAVLPWACWPPPPR